MVEVMRWASKGYLKRPMEVLVHSAEKQLTKGKRTVKSIIEQIQTQAGKVMAPQEQLLILGEPGLGSLASARCGTDLRLLGASVAVLLVRCSRRLHPRHCWLVLVVLRRLPDEQPALIVDYRLCCTRRLHHLDTPAVS